MILVPGFWQWLERSGYRIEEPRPRFDAAVEQAIEEERQEEETQGEKEPDAAPALAANVRLVRRNGRRILVYAAAATFEQGLWAVGINEIDELIRQPLPWALVLLRGDEIRGHWLTGRQVQRLAPQWSRIVSGGPNYEVREPGEIAGATPFQTSQELIPLLESLL